MTEGRAESLRISVVLIVLNMAATVRKAVESVIQQDHEAIEFIVRDGGSTDGTVEILREYASEIDHLHSAPDAGSIYALNEGVSLATGDVVCLLCADDWFEPGALARIAKRFAEDPALDLLSIGVREVRIGSDGELQNLLPRAPSDVLDFTVTNIVRFCFTHARIFRRRIYTELGGYDTQYRVTADVDFLLRAWLSGPRWATDPEPGYTYLVHEGSQTLSRSSESRRRIGIDMLHILEGHARDDRYDDTCRAELIEMHGRIGVRWLFAELLACRLRQGLHVTVRLLRMNSKLPLQLPLWIGKGLVRLALRRPPA